MKKQNKWLDNFGKADNANESNVSLADNFNGLAYNTSYRDYSPAWGGQFQQGGTLPGSVGFTYARTAGAAPSEGKYAKKTMPSAQNGVIADKIAGLELKMSPEYQYRKYLESLPQVKQAPGRGEELLRKGLGYADVATDVMQFGNFVPIPQAQFVGKIGNMAGSLVDLTQSGLDFYSGDVGSGSVNLVSAALPSIIKNQDVLGGYKRSAKYAFDNRSTYLPIDKRYGRMTEKQLLGNRTLFGVLGGETVYDSYDPKFQNGGEMKFYQEGLDWKPKSMQTGGTEKISTSDPRYPELYKNRQVGAYYDGAFTLPDLDEVTVTAPRSYTMQSLRDATSAALYGAPANVMKLSSVPQALMTEGIEMLRGKPYDFGNINPNFGSFTSNQRDPSMTMGYENPEGLLQNAANIGLSMIDPSLISGLTRRPIQKGLQQIGQNLKNVRMSIPPEMARGLKTSGISLDLNDKKLLPNDYSFQSDGNRYWLKHKNKNIGQIEYMSPRVDSQDRKWGTVNIEIDPMHRGKGLSVPMYQKILDHAEQLGHYGIISIDGSLQSPEQSKSIRKYFSGKYSEDPKLLENINKGIDEYNDIIKEDNLIFGDDEPLRPHESKFYLMSNKSKFKKGGIIKDNQGYWNPDNWGNPVEIDSNNITMQGVYEPLLGISDTGDTKLMEPGKNYKFKGSKVTEFPVAELGINQLDAQPMKKLNQLLNFTNNPDKTNWLDKYQ